MKIEATMRYPTLTTDVKPAITAMALLALPMAGMVRIIGISFAFSTGFDFVAEYTTHTIKETTGMDSIGGRAAALDPPTKPGKLVSCATWWAEVVFSSVGA